VPGLFKLPRVAKSQFGHLLNNPYKLTSTLSILYPELKGNRYGQQKHKGLGTSGCAALTQSTHTICLQALTIVFSGDTLFLQF
jgi:hypothetical protein